MNNLLINNTLVQLQLVYSCYIIKYSNNLIEIYCPNLGDSRAVMLCRTNKWFLKNLSRDHKPDCQDECERILNHGGRIDPLKD